MRNVLASQFMNPTDTNLLGFPPTRGAAFCGRAAFDLVTALLGFEGAAAAFVFSLAALMACSRCALRTSGFWFLLAKISVREAPTMAVGTFGAYVCKGRSRWCYEDSSSSNGHVHISNRGNGKL